MAKPLKALELQYPMIQIRVIKYFLHIHTQWSWCFKMQAMVSYSSSDYDVILLLLWRKGPFCELIRIYSQDEFGQKSKYIN